MCWSGKACGPIDDCCWEGGGEGKSPCCCCWCHGCCCCCCMAIAVATTSCCCLTKCCCTCRPPAPVPLVATSPYRSSILPLVDSHRLLILHESLRRVGRVLYSPLLLLLWLLLWSRRSPPIVRHRAKTPYRLPTPIWRPPLLHGIDPHGTIGLYTMNTRTSIVYIG